jgi:hypothetical protein
MNHQTIIKGFHKMENITGLPVTNKNYLKTRLFLIDEAREIIKNSSFVIEAPRRFGKTSLIKEFIRQEEIRDTEFNIIFLELEGEENVNDFCFKIFSELLNLYRVRKKIEILGRFLGDTWNVIASRLEKLDIIEAGIEIKEKTRDYNFTQWKTKIDPLVAGLNNFNRKTIIILDEFPDMLFNFKNGQMNKDDHKIVVDNLTGWLRSLRQKNKGANNYQFIFCGSINLRKTLEELKISKRINDLESFVIPPLKSEEAKELLISLSSEYGKTIESDGLNFLVSKIKDGSPYYGQIFFKALRDTRESVFTLGRVKAVYEEMMRGGHHDLNHFHSRLEEYLSQLEKECSNIILKNLCYEVSQEKTLYDLKLSEKCDYEQFQSIVNRLIYEGYILRDISDNNCLRFVSPMLKDWWAYKKGVK